MAQVAASTMDDRSSPVVLLIHGTFAAEAADEGQQWWQRGSPFQQALRQCWPQATPPADDPPFHWSGENSEWARYQAGRSLLERLRKYEARGLDYHLIGHSHGGSVIWHALRMAARRNLQLKHLRSWATIGTPFLQFRPVASLLNSLLWGGLCWALAALVLAVAMVHVEPWIEQHLPAFHLVAVMAGGMWIAGGVSLLIYAGLRNVCSIAEARQARRDRRVSRHAMRLYGERWLGLWSSEDEAINGLRHSAQWRMRLLTRHRTLATELPFLSQRPLARVSFQATAKLANVSFIPTLRDVFFQSIDDEVCAVMAALCQGNDRPGTLVEKVSPGPLPAEDGAYPPLPASVDQAIIAAANAGAAQAIGRVRRAFGQVALGGTEWNLAPLGESLTGKELAHTSYFESPAIVDLLHLHIAEQTRPVRYGVHAHHSVGAIVSDELLQWYRAFQAAVRTHVLHRLPSQSRRRLRRKRNPLMDAQPEMAPVVYSPFEEPRHQEAGHGAEREQRAAA